MILLTRETAVHGPHTTCRLALPGEPIIKLASVNSLTGLEYVL